MKGLQLYVGTSGKKTCYVHYRRTLSRQLAHHKIGDADLFGVSQAREAAQKFLALVALGQDPEPKRQDRPKTLRNLMENFYMPQMVTARKKGSYQQSMINRNFSSLMDIPLSEISIVRLEKWRTSRKGEGVKNATINRPTTVLKAVLNWAVKRELLDENPLKRLELLRETDSDTKIRYLSPEEREKLFAALDAREELMRQERDNHNEDLAERKDALLPSLRDAHFVDHLKPMMIVSLFTGIHRGSLFHLLWKDINFREKNLTIRAAIAKGGRDIQIPMTETLVKTLETWRTQTRGDEEGLVFPSPKGGGVFDNCKKAWTNLLKEADIQNFRWHDMRHDFASQLVMKGVDLNTVRELMGHADMKVTLRYAHLAPQVKRAAVELLE
jgi:integrase